MTTPFSEIYDMFMLTITDYRLDALYTLDEDEFENFLEPWLIFSINDFRDSKISLSFNEDTQTFDNTLTYREKTILANLMTKYWMQRLVNNILQMNLHVTDREFRVASEAMNLREKSVHLNHIKEQCSQMLNDYAYADNSTWDNWLSQEFYGG